MKPPLALIPAAHRSPRIRTTPARWPDGLAQRVAAVLTALALAGCAGTPTTSATPAEPPAATPYPTADRVVFVQQCMQDHRGAYFEMVNKCSCAIDTLARELSFEDYTTLSTEANALTIGGERGSVLRDNEAIGPHARQLRERIARAKQGCFIRP
ncbi:MAG: hypothetical protein RLY78_3120 [Pseudomonadota bacterium]